MTPATPMTPVAFGKTPPPATFVGGSRHRSGKADRKRTLETPVLATQERRGLSATRAPVVATQERRARSATRTPVVATPPRRARPATRSSTTRKTDNPPSMGFGTRVELTEKDRAIQDVRTQRDALRLKVLS